MVGVGDGEKQAKAIGIAEFVMKPVSGDYLADVAGRALKV